MTHDPYSVRKRKPLTDTQRLKMFVAADGKCCICGGKINAVHEMWDEHVVPLWLDGSNKEWNRAPAHEKCARKKTAKESGERSKGRDVAERHFGAKRARTKPMPCGRRSVWKKRMDGSVVRRD